VRRGRLALVARATTGCVRLPIHFRHWPALRGGHPRYANSSAKVPSGAYASANFSSSGPEKSSCRQSLAIAPTAKPGLSMRRSLVPKHPAQWRKQLSQFFDVFGDDRLPGEEVRQQPQHCCASWWSRPSCHRSLRRRRYGRMADTLAASVQPQSLPSQ